VNPEIFKGRDLLALDDFTPDEVRFVVEAAAAQKRAWIATGKGPRHDGKSVAVVLQKPSLRTHMSFEMAAVRLGMHPIMMTGSNSAFSRGESIADTARVMERYVDAIVLRTYAQSTLDELAAAARVPVINALSDDHHPCQGLADLLTILERCGRLDGVKLAYLGDGNNMAHTYLLAGALTGMDTRIATPAGYAPSADIVERAQRIAEGTGAKISVTTDARAAVEGTDVVITDTWASMGQEGEHDERVGVFVPYRVDDSMMSLADPSAIFMHCLPAHRGEEVTDSVIDGPQSVVFDEAENRLHAQKALLSLVVA